MGICDREGDQSEIWGPGAPLVGLFCRAGLPLVVLMLPPSPGLPGISTMPLLTGHSRPLRSSAGLLSQ